MIRNVKYHNLVVIFFLVIGAGCRGPSAGQPDGVNETNTQMFKGHIVYDHDVQTFRPCGSQELLWATDTTNRLQPAYQSLTTGQDQYKDLFAILRGRTSAAPAQGQGASYVAQIAVTEVIYVANEGRDCAIALESFWARGSGNEPFWGFIVSEDGIEFTSLGGDRLHWAVTRSNVTRHTVQFIGTNTADIIIDVQTDPCSDSMSGAFHGSSARVVLNGRDTLSGCVIRGSGFGPPMVGQ